MAFQIGDIAELLSELTCIKCSKLLSVFPIYISAGVNICGRCTNSIEWMISTNSIDRNTAYEALAKHILFPCSNNVFGCKVNLKHNDVQNHEKFCKFRLRVCPFNFDAVDLISQCDWKNPLVNLPTHLFCDHTLKNLSNPHTFTLNTEESNVQVNFMQIDMQTAFIVLKKYEKDQNKFYCLVMCAGEKLCHNSYSYQLELGKGEEYFLNLRKNNTEELQDTTEALKDHDKMIMVDVASAANLFGNLDYNLNCRISINKKQNEDVKPKQTLVAKPTSSPAPQKPFDLFNSTTSTEHWKTNTALPKNVQPLMANLKVKPSNEAPVDARKQKQLESNKMILEELECPVCNNYMIPPIYICAQGHSLCDDCRLKVRECPMCRVPMSTTRNYALEKLTQKVSYPCKYSQYGCNELLIASNISTHEAQCNRKTTCPIPMLHPTCSFKGQVLNPISHIYEHHSNIVLQEKVIYGRNIRSASCTSYHVTIFNNEIFIVSCKNSPTIGPLRFNFLQVGMKKDQPKYRYRLTFVDQTKKGMTFIINQLCQEVPPNISNCFKKCLEIPLDMLEPYILKKGPPTVFYKFNIEKI